MNKPLISLAAAFALTTSWTSPLAAQDEPAGAPSPNEIVEGAEAEDWVSIPAEDLLVMTLAPASDGTEREVVIQLMPAPFSQGWVKNIRTLARTGWYDDITVNRVQDNYVVQWGDLNYDNPEADGEPKLLPEGLKVMDESDYTTSGLLSVPDPRGRPRMNYHLGAMMMRNALIAANGEVPVPEGFEQALKSGDASSVKFEKVETGDAYAPLTSIVLGWPIARDFAEGGRKSSGVWPVHCYGMVGVGRNYSPDTGSGAELYTVIGHAPRHLDRNIALVGRIIEGMEHLSSLPRGSGALGFYTEEEAAKRTPIVTVRVASDLPTAERPAFEYLSTEGETFARYIEARANRRDPFFIVPAGGADICNIPVPIRRAGE
ncbi:peptidylprolyl isomerase [Erythrobacter aquimaris]|uniref:Peptidylprolyl isomerase n=1 Tax=Qipengyuania aquimaris TaxID=255984 RepID=A0A6I4TMX1_9SPHN|nr:peptidylprolyl isomerase [Qipengyuania aquimaris]MXO97314.1 peptidylprolyl isomerase [Qipengyuania aquimaris]